MNEVTCSVLQAQPSGALTCFTSSRTASRHWEWPSCRMLSLDLARCRGVRPARSRASTRAPGGTGSGEHAEQGEEEEGRGGEHSPPRSSVVMTGAWLVQAAEEGEQGLRAQDRRGLGPGCPREGAGLCLSGFRCQIKPQEASLRQQLRGFSDQTQLPPYTSGETEAGRWDPPRHKPW